MKDTTSNESAIWTELRTALSAQGIDSPEIAIHGGYGKHNLGDDAILEAILLRLKVVWPTACFSVICHDPNPVRARHSFVQAYAFRDPRVLKAIFSAHVYVIGGGGIVNRINTYSGLGRLRFLDPKGKYLFLAGWLSQWAGARLVFYSVGTTSVPDPVVKWLARAVMSRADSVSVRDPLSRSVLQEIGVKRDVLVVPDPVTSLRSAEPAWATEILGTVGVDPSKPLCTMCMRYVREAGIDNADTVRHTVQVIEWLVARQGLQVLFVPFGRHPHKRMEDDLALAREVQAQLRIRDGFWVLEQECSPSEVQAILVQTDVAILGRLHACIMATNARAHLIIVSYDAKVSTFAKLSGQEDRIIPLREFSLGTVQDKWQQLGLDQVCRGGHRQEWRS